MNVLTLNDAAKLATVPALLSMKKIQSVARYPTNDDEVCQPRIAGVGISDAVPEGHLYHWTASALEVDPGTEFAGPERTAIEAHT